MNLLKKPCRLVRERPGLSLALEVPHPRQPDPDPDPHPAILFPLLLSAIPKCSPTEALSRRILPLCLARAVPFPSVMAKARRPREGALHTRLPVLPAAHPGPRHCLPWPEGAGFHPAPPSSTWPGALPVAGPQSLSHHLSKGKKEQISSCQGRITVQCSEGTLRVWGQCFALTLTHTQTCTHARYLVFLFFFLSDLGSHVFCKSPRSPT